MELSESKARELYRDSIILIRRLFHDCHLVHADLSEFNMLYVPLKYGLLSEPNPLA